MRAAAFAPSDRDYRGAAWRPDPAGAPAPGAMLADGTAVTLRPIRRDDKALELAFLRGLSRESRYQRLLSGRDLLPGELRRLTEIDPAREAALIATIRGPDGLERQIGVARYARDDTGDAELAIVVDDTWQRRGLGEHLLRALIDAASNSGIRTLSGLTQSTNLAMLRLAKKVGFELHYQPGDATLMRLQKQLPDYVSHPDRWHAPG